MKQMKQMKQIVYLEEAYQESAGALENEIYTKEFEMELKKNLPEIFEEFAGERN